jgi:hypothetical protein
LNASEQELSDLARTVPIGRPIANTQIYILDKHQQLCPTGVAGELYIGGAGVAAGYQNDSEQTAARFVPDLFSTNPGSRIYRTGDLARYLPDATIEFLGRGDHQVKVRGYRIELGEIESTLTEHPLIRQAIVVLRHDGGRERLVAYVMSSQLRPENTVEITEFLKERLPDYMVPAPIVVMRAFPTTPNGKVDRAALPAPEAAQGANRVVIAPQTFVEIELAEIWGSLLGIDEFSVHDDFFDLEKPSIKKYRCGLSLTPQQSLNWPQRSRKRPSPFRLICSWSWTLSNRSRRKKQSVCYGINHKLIRFDLLPQVV